MRRIVDKEKAKESINEILSLFTDVSNYDALKSIDAQQYNMTTRLSSAFSHIEKVSQPQLYFELDLVPEDIFKRLNDILTKWPEQPTNQHKTSLGDVVKRTLRMVNYVNSLSTARESLKPLQPNSIVTELERLRSARESVLKQIEAEKKKEDKKDENRLEELNSTLTSLNVRIEALQKDNARIKEATQIEQSMEARIKDAFKELSRYTGVLEKERNTLVREYNFICTGIVITTIIFITWLCKIYGLVLADKLVLVDWYDIIPYYLPIPVFVAVFWVLIIQKNRANRLSYRLSEELFQIHYLEGLLLTSNKLLLDPEVSVERFNLAINSIVSSYLKRLESAQDKSEDEKMMPINATDAENIIKSLKELIQTVKK